MNLCLFEDRRVEDCSPITLTRPVFDMRCGISPLREKIEHRLSGEEIIYHVREYLKDVVREAYPDALVNQLPAEDTLFINGRVLFNEFYEIMEHENEPVLYEQDDQIFAAFVPARLISKVTVTGEEKLLSFDNISFAETHSVRWKAFRYPWEFVHSNAAEIEADIHRKNLQKSVPTSDYPQAHFVNDAQIYIGTGVTIHPGVVLDATSGPIVLDEEVTIGNNASITGPCYIGKHSKISAVSNITGDVSIGPVCKIGGEVTESIIQGYSNKKHGGFLGGSFLGEWVNLGADTNNSDLKNNYSTVSVPVNGDLVDTGLQFFGCIIGDHSKTAIGTTINTGSSIGLGSNLFGTGFPPKFIPCFSWGGADSLVEHQFSKMVETAEMVMGRREVEMTAAYRTMLDVVFQRTAGHR
ncbi:MAG: hypothetical protein K9N46_00690 [Candidatus Marinimicrobia bacterium]|nr:hypothetical protein [Candidatus Neomarinimicrobiota bacterium]MCF7828007.1 hypothetical protein [Candidatus Neomarinimicrobiota bacterium]MCF7879238.1 hypothetical protein [Candidatus Neomarinimicrobiota bacterium]